MARLKIRKAPSEQEEAGFSNQKAVKVCYAAFYTIKAHFVTSGPAFYRYKLHFALQNQSVSIL